MRYNLKNLPVWLLLNTFIVGSFIAMIFYNEYWNLYPLSIFITYFNYIVLSLLLFDAVNSKVPNKGRTVPKSISQLVDYILIIVFAYAGWYITAIIVFFGMVGEANYFKNFDKLRELNNQNKEVAQ